MASDGRLMFNTKLDNSQIDKDLRELERKIKRSQEEISNTEAKKLPLIKQAEELGGKLDAAKQKAARLKAEMESIRLAEAGADPLAAMDAYARKADVTAELKQSENEVVALQKQWDAVNDKVDAYDLKIQKANTDITRATQKTAELNAQMVKPSQIKMAQAMEKADKSASRFGRRLWEITKSALVFNLISSGLRGVVSYMGTALKSNSEYTAQLAQLKGAWLTAFQPIYEFVLPGLLAIMRVLTAIGNALASVFSFFGGKTATQSAKNAQALNKQAGAISGVGDAAEKAKKQLLGFDEINRLESTETGSSAGGGGGTGTGAIEPDFSGIKDMEEQLTQILGLVAAITAGLLTWKIASMFTDSLSIAAGLGLAVGGAMLYAFNWADAFANGIDWDNLAGMLTGMLVLAGGLGLAFGTVGAAIGLLVGSVGLIIAALVEFKKTGEVTDEMLVAIAAGCVGLGAAISLLTGNWIPLLIGLILGFGTALGITNEDVRNFVQSVLNFFLELWEWLKEIFQAIIDNWNSIWGGISSYQTTGTIAPASMPPTNARSIPALAQGAVLPANRPFMAMVGDQKNGTNIEAPLETIKQALAEVMAQYGGGDVQITFAGELAALGRVLAPVVTKAQKEDDRGRGR